MKKSCYWSCCLATALHRLSRTRTVVNIPKMNYLAFHTGTNLRTKKYGHFSRPMLTRIYKTSDTYPPFLQNIWWIRTNYSQKIKRFHKISVQKFSSYVVFTKSQSRISINLCCFFLSKHIQDIWKCCVAVLEPKFCSDLHHIFSRIPNLEFWQF